MEVTVNHDEIFTADMADNTTGVGGLERQSLEESPGESLEITQRIREFVLTKLEPRGITQVDDRESLVASGVVDSLGVFQLVAFLEDAFNIRVGDEDIALENFENIENTAHFVARKKGIGERKA